MKTRSAGMIGLGIIAIVGACEDRRSTPPLAAHHCDPAGPRVFVASAFDDELAPLLAETRDIRRVQIHGHAFVCGRLADRPVVLALLGVGPVNATRSTKLALEEFEVSAVVVVGTAGGIASNLHIGDVAIPARWSRHDLRELRWHAADPVLLALARGVHPSLQRCAESSTCAAMPAVAVGGNGVTGAAFVDDTDVGVDLDERLTATVTDMETAAVAEVADRNRVSFIAVRAVSDLVRTGRSNQLFDRHKDVAATNAASTAIDLLRATPR